MVEECKYTSETKIEDKEALMELILKNQRFREGKKIERKRITRQIRTLMDNGFSEEQSYGIFINIAAHKDYSSAIDSSEILLREAQVVKSSVDFATIQKANSIKHRNDMRKNLSEQEEHVIFDELERMGMNPEFLRTKTVENVLLAKKIVDGYQFEPPVSEKEKAKIVQAILTPEQLSKPKSQNRRPQYLSKVFANLRDMGLTEQQIYATIINMGINGTPFRGMKSASAGLAYTQFINARQELSEEKIAELKVNATVTPITRKKALADFATPEEASEAKEELRQLGIPEELLQTRSDKNIMIAKLMVENYQFGEAVEEGSLTEDKKNIQRVFITAILRNGVLTNQENAAMYNLSELAIGLEKIGLSEQEVYGAIIKLAIDNSITKKGGYGYSVLLGSNKRVLGLKQHLEEVKENSQITLKTVKNALKKDRRNAEAKKDEEEGINQEELIQIIGIPKEFLAIKSDANIAFAYKMIQRFDFEQSLGRAITDDEKRNIMLLLLTPSDLNVKKKDNTFNNFSGLINKLEDIGLEEQERYAFILKLAMNGSSLEDKVPYSILLRKTTGLDKLTREDLLKFTSITEDDLQKAQKKSGKAESFMRNQVKKLQESGRLPDLEKRMRRFDNFIGRPVAEKPEDVHEIPGEI